MPGEPLSLIVRDAPAAPAPALPLWAQVSVAAAGLIALAALGLAARRWFGAWTSRRRDPYDRLFEKVAGLAGLSERDRSSLMMACGGEPKRAVGALLTGTRPRTLRARRRPR